jgi:beta-galactosidase
MGVRRIVCFTSALLFVAATFAARPFHAGSSAPIHTFRVQGKQFLLDGKPFQIISGSIHYTRIPRAYWRNRFQLARAMGLNTITTYVFWNVHEPHPGVFNFSGQDDLAEFIREAQQEGLYVILRPGPYICGEWELGGYPSWLLSNRNLVLRSTDPAYLKAEQAWFDRLGKIVRPLLSQNGGPIIAIQLENEYGSFGNNRKYMEDVKAALLQSGMIAPVLYTADGPAELGRGTLPGLPAVVNFGDGGAEAAFAALTKFRPDGPRMTGEYWDGWFDHWGEKHHVTDGRKEAAELAWMLGKGYSVNLYMFDGGTSFGWMNGANSNGSDYQPDTTSYDYDAPVNESGNPRAKFFLFRQVIEKDEGLALPPVPAPVERRVFPIAPITESASLWSNLPKPVHSEKLLTMEDLGQSYGYILYRTALARSEGGTLIIDGLHDYAQVYVNRKLVGTLDRRLNTNQLALPVMDAPATLDILVENSGRVNFTNVIRTERKGITGSVTIGGKAPQSWEIYPLPMSDLSRLRFQGGPCEGPCFYRTQMSVGMPADTYLDTQHLRKGEVWINGRALGRFWFIGPQFALYTPGPWLHKGNNSVVFFDLKGSAADSISSVKDPIFSGATGIRN